MKPDNTNIGEGESLEYAPSAAQDSGVPTVVVPEAERRRLSPFRYNKLAFVIAGLAVLLITAVAVGSFVLFNRPSSQKNASDQAANYKVGDISLQDVQANAQLKVGTADKLAINGQLQVSNTLVLAPTPAPTAPARGQIYFDQVTNQPYYYDGVRFVSLAPTVLPQVVNSIGGVSGALGLGAGLEVINGQLGVSAVFTQQLGGARVTSLQGQTGDVQLVAGSGIGINGTTISNQGVINLNAGSGISVTADGNGAYTVTNTVVGLSGSGSAGQIAMFTGSQALGDSILSQSGSALTVAGTLTVTGAISANTLQQTAPGLDVSISAGNDDLIFTAGGRTFVFPTSGPASQTICTTGVSCASGGGQAVILQPGSVQTDTGSDESVFINNTGGGTLIRLQGNGNDRLVIANNGNTTIGGSLTVQGSGGLVVGVPGSTNGAITLASNLNTNTGSVQIASLGQNTIYTLPDPGGAAATICLSTGNCSGGGVTSFNGLTGALVLNNSSGVGSTITIDDASTSAKGIAQFNATNFTASSGTINTIQDIATTSAPTFGGLTLTSALTVANGGTGAGTFTSNGILFGNGTGALQSTAAAANSVLVTNGSNVPSLSQTLPTAVQGNITGTGVLISGSIAAGFGTISTNSNISTTATVQGANVNATTAIQLNGNDINNPGTLSNVAYENQANNFTASNTFSAAGTGLAVTNNATIGGTLAVQGAGGITAGVAGATTGTINLANTSSTRMVSLQGLNPSGTGNAIIQFPTIAGGSTDTVCLFTLGNCVSGVTSINGQTGAVTINNASGSGAAITIDDASTSTKGIAQFNATNFTASGGTINTIQGIATTSAPTFAGLTLTSALTVANGGTGAGTFTSNGILYGNGTGALQVTSAAANSVLATNGSSVPSLVQTLPNAVQGNITSTGVLTSGSIASGFGTISTGNNITTTAAVQGATINATSALQLGGVDINTAGTLTNVAYENQANNFTASNTFSAAGTALAVTNNATIGGTLNGQTISSAANFTGTLVVQGAGGITVGIAGTTTGSISLANSTSTRLVTIQGLNPSGTGNATVQVPTIAGGSTDTFCLQTLNNCAVAGAITGSGTTNYLARFTGASTLGIGTIYDSGTAVSVGGSSPSALFNVGASNQFQVSSTGAVTAVGVNAGSGLLQGTGGLTVGGTITFSSLNSAGVVKTDGLGQLSTGVVALGTETSGDYVANLGTLTGLSTTGNSGEGSTPSLSVLYGSTANTAVQGNTSLTCASGTGNLSGGGNSVTLGAGGSCNNITISNSPTFSGTVTVQGAGGVVLGVAGATTGSLNLANSANANIGTLQIASLGQATTFVLPDPGQASVNICLSTGNCAGSGGGITGSGTTGRLSKFSGSGTITDSTLSESGSTLTASGNLVIQGTNSLTLGVASATDGSIAFKNSNGIRTVTLQAPQTDPAGDITFFLPNADGSNGDCLTTNGTGGLAFTSCTGGAGGGVTSLNGQIGVVNINNASGSGGAITIDDASTSAKGIAQFNATNFTASSGTINTIQDIATTSSPTFAGLTLTNDLTVANGGTGVSTFTSNGILYGNGTGALQVTAAAANSILVTNGSNIPSLSQTLPTAVQGNITSTGALTSGSIASGFGTIATGNNITTTATVQGGTVNATSAIQLNGADINTAGTLTNVAYENQANVFTAANLFQNTANSTTAFQIQNAAGTSNLFVADTTNTRIGIGVAPSYTLDVAGDINTTGVYRVNGTQISSANLSNDANLAKLNGTNNFTAANTFSAAGTALAVTNNATIGGTLNGQTISSAANFTGTLAVQGGGGLTIGVQGSVTGSLNLANSTSSRMVILQGLNPSGTGNATVQIPTIAGGSTDTVCLLTLGNCALAGGITGSGTANYTARFTGANTIAIGTIYDDGTLVSVGGSSPAALFNVGASNQFQVSSVGAVTAVGVNAGTGLIQGTGGLNVTGGSTLGGTTTLSALGAGLVQSSSGGVLSSGAVDRNSATFFNTALTVANGGTGAATFTSNGILYGNGTSALQVTTAAANSVLVTDGSNIPSLSQTLPTAVQSNITGTGALTSGSIASGFGTISTGNNITTSATVQGGTLNGTSAIQLNGVDINTAGTLTNVAYENQANTFTQTNTFSGDVNANGTLTVTNGNASGGLQVLSGSSIVNSTIGFGRTTPEFQFGIAAGAGQFIAGTSTGDVIQKQLGTGAIILTNGTNPDLSVLGGNVGIGVRSASTKLDVRGTTRVAVTSTTAFQVQDGSLNPAVLTVDTSASTISATGALTVTNGAATGGIRLLSGGASTNSTLAIGRASSDFQVGIAGSAGQFIAGTSTGDVIQKQLGSGAIILSNGTNPDLSVLSGNVGIGMRAATYKLDVSGGDINTSGTYRIAGIDINTAGTLTNVAYENQANTFTAANLFQNSSDSTTAFRIQNAAGTSNLFIADTTNTRIGIGATPATSLLTVGTNTTAASGGITFGTDTNLYRSASNTLKTDDNLEVAGTTYSQGSLTVGTGSVSANLVVRGSSYNGLQVNVYSDTASGYNFFQRARGTIGSPTATQSGDYLGSFGFRGYDGAGFFTQDGARFSALATQNHSAGIQGTALAFYTAANGSSTASERLRIDQSGYVGFGTASNINSRITLVADTTAAGGILFGTDTNLYRSGANALTTDDSLSIGGALTVTGASALRGGATLGIAGSAIGQLVFAHSGNTNLGTVQIASLGQATTFTLPDPGGASATICLSTGNCAGAGTGITGTGTSGALARFSSSNNIVDSTLSESGSVLTASGTLVIQGASSLTLGTSSTNDGAIIFRNNSGANTVTLAAPLNNPASSLTFRLPSADGGVGDCLVTDASGNLSFAACGGGGGGVTSLNSQTGAVTINNASGAGGAITIDNASTTVKGIAQFNSTNFTASSGTINTIQDIATTSSPTFATLNATSGLQLNGVNINTAGTLTNVAYENQANTFTEANLFRNTVNSTTAFQIQDSAGTGYLLTADTSNGVIKVGTTASATQAGTALFATAAEFSGALRVGDGTNRVQVDGTTKKITYVGTARQDRRVTLQPEYAGAVLTADGSNNVGTMTSDFCSGSSRLNLNTSICGSTDEFNYYSWIGSGGTMDYDIYVRWQVPSDFDGFKDATDAVKMYGWRTTSTEKVELAMFQANGTQCGSTTEINSSNTTWQETSMTGDETACSVSPNDIITFRIKVTAGSSGYARASNIQINYLSKF